MKAVTRGMVAGLLLAAISAGLPAHAETRLVAGAQLVLTNTQDGLVIGADPKLSGTIRLTRDDGLSCLTVITGTSVVVDTEGCGSDSSPLRIDVSPGTSVTLTSRGSGNVHVGDLTGLLVATMTGSGDLAVRRVGGLVLALQSSGDAAVGQVDGPATMDLTGSGDAQIRKLTGPLVLKQTSSGDLVVGTINAESVTTDSTGAGDVVIGGGHIGSLRATVGGSSDLSVAAAISNADVDAHGGSDVKLVSVSGTLNRHASGGSTIVVGEGDVAATIADKVSRKFGNGRNTDLATLVTVNGSPIRHVLTALGAGLILFICWRVVRRAGGLGSLRQQFGGRMPQAPTSPAVLALSETMTRLDQRLGRLETYVTTREFDLNRKFRELGS